MKQSIVHIIVGITSAFVMAAVSAGCSREDAETPSQDNPISYPDDLDAESSSSQVAAVFVDALDKGDEDTLLGLVATEAAAKDLNRIYRKHGRKGAITSSKAAAMTAAGWKATYSFFQTGKTRVRRHEIDGEKAKVFASGVARGRQSRTLKISMIRENGVWKILPGLENLPE